MIVRKITADDNAALAAIIRNSLLEFNAAKPGTVYFDSSTDHLSNLFTIPKSAYFVVIINETIAGGAGIYPTEGLNEDTCELVKMYISSEYRGNGIGQMLLNKCMEEAKRIGYKKIYLETMPELIKAISMYEKNLFTKLPAPLGNSGHTGCDIWMIKELRS